MSKRCRAFSLIELLVVLAILALLLAILAPSLRRARFAAKSTVCLSNLKSIGAAMIMYQGDNRAWLPVGPADRLSYIDGQYNVYSEPGPGRRPYPWSNCHWGGKRAAWIHNLWPSPPQPETLKRPLTNYLYPGAGLDEATPLFECPDDAGSPLCPNPVGPYAIHYLCGNSYYINPWGKPPQPGQQRLRIPSIIVLVEEASMYFAVSRGTLAEGWHGRPNVHNLLFLDFHAASRNLDTRQHYGPGWFAENYFEIMDYYTR